MKGDGLGFQPKGREGQTKEALGQHFTPEFLGRIDAIVPFVPLSSEAMEGIAKKYLTQLVTRVSASGIQLVLPDELARELSKDIKSDSGARNIRHLVQEQVEGPLAEHLLKCSKKPFKIKSRLENGKLIFQS